MGGITGALHSVAGNTAAAAAGRIFAGGVAFLATAILARVLGPDSFGEYSGILALLYLFNAAADLGLYNFLLRQISSENVNASQVLREVLGLRVAALTLFLLAGVATAYFTLELSHASLIGLVVAASMFAAQSLTQLGLAPLQKNLAVYKASFVEGLARILQLVLTILAAALMPSIDVFIGVLALASLLQLGLVWRSASQWAGFSLTFSFSRLKAVFAETLPIGISLIFTLIYFRLDTVLLALLRSDREVGLYNLSYKILENLIFFPAAFVGLVMPRLSRASSQQRWDDFGKIYRSAANIIVAASLPLVVGGWFLAEPLAVLLGGREFLEAAIPLRILLFATALIFAGTILGSAVIAAGLQKKAVKVYCAAMLFNVSVNLLLIPKFGYMAAAFVTVVTEVIVDAGLVWVLWNTINPGVSARAIAAAIFATLLMAVPLVLFSQGAFQNFGALSVVPFVVVCPIIFAAAFVALGGASYAERAILFAKKEEF